ncbi:uncharacterized protein LOC117180116 isoform X3 [Belonocnema kinseyi]|uniref:uncharacterized protein LOC117180116 isoform X3 n=1 Tax=Belonocnema kinseyi TaxID=2817044 RepID=UPI00143D2DBA|nr:uncharacterized protein LOC117180116 isoform X3 [Belonocnema kinseyi]
MSLNDKFRDRDNNFFLSTLQRKDPVPNYDIGQLILQQCDFVEIGEGFCALFVELKSNPRKTAETQIAEFFLGICHCASFCCGKLCSPELLDMRKAGCIFIEATATANTSSSVYRKFCDTAFLSSVSPICSIPLAGQQLYRTEGSNPLPTSICSTRGYCGVPECAVNTIKGIHLTTFDPNIRQKKPFCKDVGPWTSVPPIITSFWSKCSIPKSHATDVRGLLVSTSFCYNQVTRRKAIYFIETGSFCYPYSPEVYQYKVKIDNGIIKSRRFTELCKSSESCPVIIEDRNFLSESQFEESKHYGINEIFHNYPEPISLSHRRLLQNLDYDTNDYEIMSSNDDDNEFEGNEINEQMGAIGEDVADNNYIEYDPEMKYSDNELVDDDDEEEEDDEDEEDDMMAFRKTRGRRNHINRDRVLRSDDEASFTRQSRYLGFPFSRKKLPKEKFQCEDPSVTELPIYRDYDPANSSRVPIKTQISFLVFFASMTMSALGSFFQEEIVT